MYENRVDTFRRLNPLLPQGQSHFAPQNKEDL